MTAGTAVVGDASLDGVVAATPADLMIMGYRVSWFLSGAGRADFQVTGHDQGRAVGRLYSSDAWLAAGSTAGTNRYNAFVEIRGRQHYLPRAVDKNGEVVEMFLQTRREGKATRLVLG